MAIKLHSSQLFIGARELRLTCELRIVLFLNYRGYAVMPTGGLSPTPSSARSLSPMERSAAGYNDSRRRQSTSSVPNNVIPLRLADPNNNGSGENGGGFEKGSEAPRYFPMQSMSKALYRGIQPALIGTAHQILVQPGTPVHFKHAC
ncbi:hypothetical protein GE21DRAFT_1310535 [Neurospora crassa]|nr:hypothetical protein GE21DRAFT_1310535 [Neurospora crassa]